MTRPSEPPWTIEPTPTERATANLIGIARSISTAHNAATVSPFMWDMLRSAVDGYDAAVQAARLEPDPPAGIGPLVKDGFHLYRPVHSSTVPGPDECKQCGLPFDTPEHRNIGYVPVDGRYGGRQIGLWLRSSEYGTGNDGPNVMWGWI